MTDSPDLAAAAIALSGLPDDEARRHSPALWAALDAGDEPLAGHVRALTKADRVPQEANLTLLAAYEKLERLGRPLRAVVDVLDAPERAQDGPLLGVPVAIKDMIDVRGCIRGDGNPTAMGGSPAEHDAPVIQRLRAAAADVFTTTSLLEYAAGAPHPDLPEALNPVRPDRTAGGSSGGSAALVGAGVCPAALGTDTGGSIRLPAHYCGIVGIKPTHGLVPLEGITPLSPSLDSCGVLAVDVATTARVLAVLADRPELAVAAAAARGIDGLRIGVLAGQLAHEALEPELRDKTQAVIEKLRAAGATITEVDDAVLTELGDLLVPILLPEAWEVHGERVVSTPGHYGADTLRLFEAAGESDPAERERALARRAELLPQAEALLDGVDVLLGPAAPYPAPELTPPIDTPEGEVEGLFSGPFNVTGQPALVLPAGRTDYGLPFAIQLAARRRADGELLTAAARIEAELR